MDATGPDPLLGRLLDRRYRVDTRIARGGMATVYLAVDTRLDRTVAVKVMHPWLAGDPDFLARFAREAKSAARLSHPNVVSVYDQGRDGDTVFLAMEYVHGRTLRDLVREQGALRPRQALGILEPVLAALAAAHAAGIVHRDVKPENVLLAEDGRVKVADFGLARAVSSASGATSAQGLLIGTVAYLSPEQVTRGVADARSDVYAAGIVLYELLTGSPPFQGDSALAVAYRHVHDEVPPPSARRPGLPAAADDLVRRATSRDPDARPADAARLLADVLPVRLALAPDPPERPVSSEDDRTLVVPRPATPPGARAAGRGATTLILARDRRDPDALAAAAGDADATVLAPHHPPGGSPGAGGPGARRARSRRGLVALLVVLALATALGIAGWSAGGGQAPRLPDLPLLRSSQPQVEVPDVVGDAAEQARDRLAGAGLDPDLAERYDADVPRGVVMAQEPRTGTAYRGDRVVLTVSRGPRLVPVPRVLDRRVEDARRELEEAGFTVRTRGVEILGRVLAQDPARGRAPEGSTVTLTTL